MLIASKSVNRYSKKVPTLRQNNLPKDSIYITKTVRLGNTVFLIKHNLDVIKSCAYIIDLKPKGGKMAEH